MLAYSCMLAFRAVSRIFLRLRLCGRETDPRTSGILSDDDSEFTPRRLSSLRRARAHTLKVIVRMNYVFRGRQLIAAAVTACYFSRKASVGHFSMQRFIVIPCRSM